MTKISLLPEDTAPTTDDYTVSVDNLSGSTKKVKWLNLGSLFAAAILPITYPVGCTYIETTGVNPATTFGFGTWVAYAQGQALVGVAASGTFAGQGTVVGEERHTLSTSEMPNHNHTLHDPGHSHALNQDVVSTAGFNNNRTYSGGSGQQLQWGATGINSNSTAIWIDAAGGGTSHNNIQPSITVCIWKRTA